MNRRRGFLFVLAACLVAAACNPLLADPTSLGGEIEVTGARYTGPDGAWLQVLVNGAPEHSVFALALIDLDELQGPEERSCSIGTGDVVPCTVNIGFLQSPNQRIVAGDGSEFVNVITAWSGEPAQFGLVCVHPDTQELGCPPTLRMAIRSVDESGTPVGDLVPAPTSQ